MTISMHTDRPLINVGRRKLTIGPSGTTVNLTDTSEAQVLDAWGAEISLTEGLYLWLYEPETNEAGLRDDLLLEGKAHFDTAGQRWIVEVENARVRRHSQIQPDEPHWANSIAWQRVKQHEELARGSKRARALVSRLGGALSRGRRDSDPTPLSDPARLQPHCELWLSRHMRPDAYCFRDG
jgi:hypothetical protein